MPDSSPEGACARALTRQALVRAYSAAPPAVRGLLSYLVCASFDLTERLLDGRVLTDAASSLSPSAARAAEVFALGLAVRELMRKDAEAFPRDSFGIHFFEVFTAPLRAYAAEEPALLRLIENAAQMIGLLLAEEEGIDADICALLEEKLRRLGADEEEIRRCVRVLDDLMRFLGAVSEVGEDFPAHRASEAELVERLETFTPDDRGASLFLLRSLSVVIFETVGESETELGKRLVAAVLLPSVLAALFAQAMTVRKILPEYEQETAGWLREGGLMRMDEAVKRLATVFARAQFADPCHTALFLLLRCLRAVQSDSEPSVGHHAERLLGGLQ